MRLKFTKMHGCGNDYVYVNCFEQTIDDPEGLAKRLANRRFSVGGDGLILICPADAADAKMKMYNADGSEGKMCGNGIRCVAKYVYETGIARKKRLAIDTISGVKQIDLILGDYGKAVGATVNMGRATLETAEIPAVLPPKTVIDYPFEAGGVEYRITCVNMSNPHCVIFTQTDVADIEIEKIGPLFENNAVFPERVNTEFVNITDETTLKMRVWERGSGETLACGTGACATAVAAVVNGHCAEGKDIRVQLVGGDLIINYTAERVLMTGPAVTVFEGVIEV